MPEQGRIAVNFINDLVLVHHQQSSTSLAYDIELRGEDIGSGVQRHFPILPPMSLAEVNISCKGEAIPFSTFYLLDMSTMNYLYAF